MRNAFSLPLLAALAACTVGPEYAGPPIVGTNAPPPEFARTTAAVATTEPAVAAWWTALDDPVLDQLERRALAGNLSIAVAEARLRRARASIRLERANSMPAANANATYVQAHIPGLDVSNSGDDNGNGDSGFHFFNLGFDASWEIDLFGGRRRAVEAAHAGAAAAEADVADAQVSLTAEVAQAYVNLRDRQQRVVLARQSADLQRRMLALVEQRFDRGTASALDVERLRGEAENADAQIPPLGAELQTYLNALAVLIGAEPGALDALLVAPAAVPLPPASVAVGDPAALLQRRPDIRSAERQLAARTAQIGVAEAARFPKLSLMGIIGIGGVNPGDLVDVDNITALAAPRLQWNALDFGRGAARVEQAKAGRDEADATYRGKVLAGLRDAEDSLVRFGAQREALGTFARAHRSAGRAADLMQQRFRAGTVTLTDVLDVERRRLASEQNLVSATSGLTSAFISLQKALGLGWQTPEVRQAGG